MCCSKILIMFESKRVWMGTKCTRSDVLNQPWIESVWCVYLSELEQVLTGASGSCCMNHRFSNLHEEKTTCYSLMFWSLTSLGTVQLLFKKVSLQISTNWVWDMQGFRSRSTSSTHCMGNLWFAPSLHSLFLPPPHIGTLWPSSFLTFVVKSVLFDFTPNGLLESVYVPLMHITHCGAAWYGLSHNLSLAKYSNVKRND